MNIEDLKPNNANPRKISKHDYEALKKSLKEFGDLSSVVFNDTTKQLVGGHMRTRSIKDIGNVNIQITQSFETPTRTGTTALGYITLDGEAYPYRQVAWPLDRELAANIAANRISGEFDVDLLAEVTYQIQQANPDLLELTGQTQKEIDNLLKSVGVGSDDDSDNAEDNDDEDDKLTFKLTADQKKLVESAIQHVKITREMPTGEAEAKNGMALYYMAQHYVETNPPLTTEQLGAEFTPPELPTA